MLVNDFDFENLQKKRLAGMAKYRRRGSKSKKQPVRPKMRQLYATASAAMQSAVFLPTRFAE